MKIILLKDVPKVGRRGEVKDVKKGFGRNYLLSKGFAQIATPKTEAESKAVLAQAAILSEKKQAEREELKLLKEEKEKVLEKKREEKKEEKKKRLRLRGEQETIEPKRG